MQIEQRMPHIWTGKQKARVAAASDTGRVRDSNQDNYHFNPETGLYLVADGMGGRAGGEVASALACEAISSEIKTNQARLGDLDVNGRRALLAASINKASLKIYERSLELPQFRGMGTTTTLLWIPPRSDDPENLSEFGIIAHVGDSRCYLWRAGFLFQMTDDHSLVNEQIKAGILSPRDPLISQMRNVITRCVGYQEEEEVDTIAFRIYEDDRFLLCSDGLTNKVSDEEIREALSNGKGQNLCDQLVAKANEMGGEDNITVMIVDL